MELDYFKPSRDNLILTALFLIVQNVGNALFLPLMSSVSPEMEELASAQMGVSDPLVLGMNLLANLLLFYIMASIAIYWIKER